MNTTDGLIQENSDGSDSDAPIETPWSAGCLFLAVVIVTVLAAVVGLLAGLWVGSNP